jgi:putative spermidine/putrescine transport system permease protein
LVLPIFVVIPISFSSAEYLTFPPPGLSLRWYEAYLGDSTWTQATLRSVQVGAATMVLALILGSLAAYALARTKFRAKSLVYAFLISPMIVPEVITAIAVYFLVAKLGLVGNPLGLVLGHTVFALPPAIILITSVLQTFDWSLERAALSLGAGRLMAFRRVIIPILLPGMLSAALLAFLRSFDELIMAMFIASYGATTLPKKMWEGLREEINPTIASVSTLLIVFSVLAMLALQILQRRRRTSR